MQNTIRYLFPLEGHNNRGRGSNSFRSYRHRVSLGYTAFVNFHWRVLYWHPSYYSLLHAQEPSCTLPPRVSALCFYLLNPGILACPRKIRGIHDQDILLFVRNVSPATSSPGILAAVVTAAAMTVTGVFTIHKPPHGRTTILVSSLGSTLGILDAIVAVAAAFLASVFVLERGWCVVTGGLSFLCFLEL